MVICDTSGVLAFADETSRQHKAVLAALRSAVPPFIINPLILAECDYMLRRGVRARDRVRLAMNQIIRPPFEVAQLSFPEISAAMEVDERYSELNLGVSRASLIVLAEKYDTNALLTLSEERFRAVTPLQGGSFTLLPST